MQSSSQDRRKTRWAWGVTIGLGVAIIVLSLGVVAFRMTSQWRLRRHLRQVSSAFDRCELNYWLDYGSLLGAVRGGDVIAFDNDNDVSMLQADRDALMRCGKSEGLWLITNKDDHVDYISIISPTLGTSLDVALRQENPLHGTADRLVDPTPDAERTQRNALDPKDVFPIERRLFPKISLNALPIPHRPEKILEQYYGADWRIPRKGHHA